MNESENKGCQKTIIMLILGILAIALLIGAGATLAPLDKLQVEHTEIVQP